MTDRSGLYVMMTLTMLASMDSCSKTGKMQKSISKIPTLELRVQDVIGESTPDKFYDIGNQRAYVEIDGKPMRAYLQK